jgi:hypothetical protein
VERILTQLAGKTEMNPHGPETAGVNTGRLPSPWLDATFACYRRETVTMKRERRTRHV